MTQFAAQLKIHWVGVLLGLVSVVFSILTIAPHGRQMSQLDEWVYLDYLHQIPTQGFVREGADLSSWSLDLMSCDGQVPWGAVGPPYCGNHNANEYPQSGKTSAAVYTPLAFYPTYLVGSAIGVVSQADQITSWRIAHSFWLLAGILMLTYLLRLWKVPNLAQLGIGLMLIGSSLSYWTYTYVSTDAPSLFFGALLLSLATKMVRTGKGGYWLVAVAVIATAMKVTNLMAVGMTLTFIGLSIFYQRKIRPPALSKLLIIQASAAIIFSVFFEFVWLKIVHLLAVGTNGDQGVSMLPTVGEIFRLMTTWTEIPGIFVGVTGPQGINAIPYPTYLGEPFRWLIIAGVFGSFIALGRQISEEKTLVLSVFWGSIFAFAFMAAALFLATGSYFPLQTRYGLSLLPGALILAGMRLKYVWALKGSIAIGILMIACSIVSSYWTSASVLPTP